MAVSEATIAPVDVRGRTDLAEATLLVVDDSEMMRSLLCTALESFQVKEVHVTDRPDKALEILEEKQIDAVIVDWQMSPTTGVELTRSIRWDLEDPLRRIPIIMCTGHTEVSKVIEARDSGINEFVRKPVEPDILYDKVMAALQDTRPFLVANNYVGPQPRHSTRNIGFEVAPEEKEIPAPAQRNAGPDDDFFDLDAID